MKKLRVLLVTGLVLSFMLVSWTSINRNANPTSPITDAEKKCQAKLVEIYPFFEKYGGLPIVKIVDPVGWHTRYPYFSLDQLKNKVVALYDPETDCLELSKNFTFKNGQLKEGKVVKVLKHEGAHAFWARMGRYNLRLVTMMVVRLPEDSELYKKVKSLYPRGDFENSVEYKERMSNEMLAHLAEGCYTTPEGWWGEIASELLFTFSRAVPNSVLKEVEHTFTPSSENSE